MTDLIKEILSYIGLALPALIIITNPVSAASFFISLTEEMKQKEIKRTALKACLASMWVMSVFAIFGTFIFKIFNITIHAFQIAGGIILFGVAMDIRKGRRSEPSASQKGDDLSIVPLAIPMIAGPGAITTCLMLAGEANNIIFLGVLVACIAVSLIIMYVALTHSSKFTSVLGEGGVRIIVRLMGLILAVIAIQFVLNGIKGAIPTLVPVISKCLKLP
jgi:multiple antibiotic resistance protein